MDQQALQRLIIAQEVIQSLVNLIQLHQVPATHAQVQGILDGAATKLRILDVQATAVTAPLVVPSLVPPGTVIPPAQVTTTVTTTTPTPVGGT